MKARVNIWDLSKRRMHYRRFSTRKTYSINIKTSRKGNNIYNKQISSINTRSKSCRLLLINQNISRIPSLKIIINHRRSQKMKTKINLHIYRSVQNNKSFRTNSMWICWNQQIRKYISQNWLFGKKPKLLSQKTIRWWERFRWGLARTASKRNNNLTSSLCTLWKSPSAILLHCFQMLHQLRSWLRPTIQINLLQITTWIQVQRRLFWWLRIRKGQ